MIPELRSPRGWYSDMVGFGVWIKSSFSLSLPLFLLPLSPPYPPFPPPFPHLRDLGII